MFACTLPWHGEVVCFDNIKERAGNTGCLPHQKILLDHVCGGVFSKCVNSR
jgi:hypothetical protein